MILEMHNCIKVMSGVEINEACRRGGRQRDGEKKHQKEKGKERQLESTEPQKMQSTEPANKVTDVYSHFLKGFSISEIMATNWICMWEGCWLTSCAETDLFRVNSCHS